MKFISENHELAWNHTLALLKPTQAQLEHGLELHKNLFCMDGFGFLDTIVVETSQRSHQSQVEFSEAFRLVQVVDTQA